MEMFKQFYDGYKSTIIKLIINLNYTILKNV